MVGGGGYNTHFCKTLKIILLSCLAISSYGFLIITDFYKFNFSNNRNLYYGIPALLFVTAILFMEKDIRENKIIRFGMELGEASYVMYLIHLHIVVLLGKVVFDKLIGTNSNFILELIETIIAIVVTIIFSILVYRFIDKPIQKYLRNVLKKYK
jgi:peptidoglycan/LPS O-acetylase OafA/YrhL